jgi:uncharacterized membrane protein YeaQ/YmgE (transglycosylase-associated protein family)
MDILSALIASILAGNVAVLFTGGYSLGLIGNTCSGLVGGYFLSSYVGLLFHMGTYPSQLCASFASALFILLACKFFEPLVAKKTRIL